MSWNVLRLAHWIVDFIAATSFLTLLFPWFAMGALTIGWEEGIALYGYLVVIALLTRYGTRYLERYLASLEEKKRKFVTISFIVCSALIILFVLGWPQTRSLPFSFLIRALLGLVAWMWGVKSGMEKVDTGHLHRLLTGGAVVLSIFYYVAFRADVWNELSHIMSPLFLIWFFCTIIAVALHGVLEQHQEISKQKERVFRFWAPVVALIAVIFTISALLFSVFSPALFRLLHTPVQIAWYLLQYVFQLFLFALSYLVWAIYHVLTIILRPFDMELEPMEQDMEIGDIEHMITPPEGEFLSENVLQWAGILLIVLVLGILAFTLLMASRKKDMEEDPDETRESYASLSSFTRWAGDSWSRFARRFQGSLTRFRPWPLATATAMYQAMLRGLAQRGCQRYRKTTPHVFQSRVRATIPRTQKEADRILGAFVREYYGQEVLEEKEIQSLRGDYEEIKSDLSGKKKGQ